MGSQPAVMFVDAHCRVHASPNLHVAGSAVFSTSGQANPTFLIVCLALRLAKRLIADLTRTPKIVANGAKDCPL